MRTVLVVALLSAVAACATLGGSEPDPYGFYDVVSVNGEEAPTAEMSEGWVELGDDGTGTLTVIMVGSNEPTEFPFTFSLGELTDGCFPYESPGEEGVMWTGSICGDVFTTSSPDMTVVLNKRR